MADLIAEVYWTHIEDHCKGRLLDLGCGNVPLFEVYRNFVKENICVDWAHTLHKNKYIDHECDLSRKLPLADASFDTIILSDVLEHIPEPANLWQEMFRLLKPQGKVLMNVPFYYWLHETPHDYYRYTEHALRRFAKMTGFDVLLIATIGGVPEIVTDIVAKNLLRLGRLGSVAAIAVQSACYRFIHTSVGRKISQNTATNFPLGYFMIAQKRSEQKGLGAKIGEPG